MISLLAYKMYFYALFHRMCWSIVFVVCILVLCTRYVYVTVFTLNLLTSEGNQRWPEDGRKESHCDTSTHHKLPGEMKRLRRRRRRLIGCPNLASRQLRRSCYYLNSAKTLRNLWRRVQLSQIHPARSGFWPLYSRWRPMQSCWRDCEALASLRD